MLDTMLMGIVGRAIDGYEKWAKTPATKATLQSTREAKKNKRKPQPKRSRHFVVPTAVHYHQHIASHIHYHQHR